MTTEQLLSQYDSLAEAAEESSGGPETQAILKEMEQLARELNSRGVCAKCGSLFAVHNDDGGCVEDAQ